MVYLDQLPTNGKPANGTEVHRYCGRAPGEAGLLYVSAKKPSAKHARS